MATAQTSENNNGGKTMIHVENVKKAFHGEEVLSGVSFDVKEGEVLGIIGISGSGKSTLLKIIAGLEEADHGDVTLNDDNYSMVFQYSALFDSLSVLENVGFSLLEEPDVKQYAGRTEYTEDEVRKIVVEKLHLVGLDDVEDKFPNELSGGMKKRVSFARAIVANPKIILYDEPTAGLDPIASTVIEDYILKLRDELGAASVVVTHQFSTIQRAADRICLLHDGIIQWIGTPQELMTSDNPYAKQFATASLEGPMTPKD